MNPIFVGIRNTELAAGQDDVTATCFFWREICNCNFYNVKSILLVPTFSGVKVAFSDLNCSVPPGQGE